MIRPNISPIQEKSENVEYKTQFGLIIDSLTIINSKYLGKPYPFKYIPEKFKITNAIREAHSLTITNSRFFGQPDPTALKLKFCKQPNYFTQPAKTENNERTHLPTRVFWNKALL